MSPLAADTHTARWDLTFNLAERFTEAGSRPGSVDGGVPHRCLRPDSIEVLTARLRRVLVAMVADPGQRLSSALMWLTRVSVAALRCGVIRRPLVRVGGASVPEVFAWQVIRVPGRWRCASRVFR